MKSSRHGFTLVELLVVIGIIALLISILMPALQKVRKSANSLACMSNMRQVAMGILYYAQANKDWCPPAMEENSVWYNSIWTRRLFDYKYVTDRRIFYCPEDVDADAAIAAFFPTLNWWGDGNYAWWHLSSYGVNVYFGIPYYGAPNPPWPWYRPFKDFNNKPILGEPLWLSPALQRPFMQPDTLRSTRHSRYTNLAYGDVHVESVANDVVFPYGDARWDPNQ